MGWKKDTKRFNKMQKQIVKCNCGHSILTAREFTNGGKRRVNNGAILTLNAHKYLNYLDCQYERIYKELNGLFWELNKTYKPPQEDYFAEVAYVLKKVGRR